MKDFYHNKNDEPMFREYKVRNLPELFEKEENFREFTLELFKEWLKNAAPEEDWTNIKTWGMLYEFRCFHFIDFTIFEYLFQLGMEPLYIAISSLDMIETCERSLKDPNYEYIEQSKEQLKDSKKLFNICKKYMSEEDLKLAYKVKETYMFL